MNIYVEEAIQWITENFPAPAVSDTEIQKIIGWSIRKSLFLKDQLERLRLTLIALRQMAIEKSSGKPQCQRATFSEAFSDELRRMDDYIKGPFSGQPGPAFLENIKRITSWDYNILGDRKQDDRVMDGWTIFLVYSQVLPRMGSVAPSFLLALSHAEAGFVALTTDQTTLVMARESVKKGSSDSVNITAARAKMERRRSGKDRELVVEIFEALSEKTKKEISTNPNNLYRVFTNKAKSDSVRPLWTKRNKKGEPAWPSKQTFLKIVKEYLNSSK